MSQFKKYSDLVIQLKEDSILQVPLAKLKKGEIMQAPLAQITWYHHITLLDKVKDKEERFFYIQQTAEHGWSRNVLVHQIESGLYKRKGVAITNFHATLPSASKRPGQRAFKRPL